MARPQTSRFGVRAPRLWLGVAFVGVWLYFIAKVLEIYSDRFAQSADLAPAEARQVLSIIAGLASILFFSGLVAALWRANLATGLSGSSVRGLVVGSAGVGVLVIFAIAQMLDWIGIRLASLQSLLGANQLGDIAGNALAFAGLAFLCVGLAESVGIFRRAKTETPRPAADEST